MSDRTRIELEVDASDAFRSLEDLQETANRIGAEVMDVKRQALRELRDVTIASRRIISGITQLFRGFGLALDPFQQALIQIGFTTVEALTAIAAAEASTIVGIPLATKLLVVTLGLQLVTLPAIFEGTRDAKQQADRAVALVEGLASFADAAALFGGL
jgi:hypothetical protein